MKISMIDLVLWEKIENLGNYESGDIWSRFHNKLGSLRCKNYKDIIKVETLMKIPVPYYGETEYKSSFMFDITPKQAEEIIKELQRVLKNRKR